MMHPTPPPLLSQRTSHHQAQQSRHFYNNMNTTSSSTENDAISHTGSSHSPLRTQQQQPPPPPTHGIPLFQNQHRKKGRHRSSMYPDNDNHTHSFYNNYHNNNSAASFVQNAMKLILLSPVLVLVIWSVTAITWTNQQMKFQQLNTGSSNTGMNYHPRTSTRRQQQQQRKSRESWSLLPFRNRRTVVAAQPPQQQQGPLIVQPNFVIPSSSQQQQQQQEQPRYGSMEDYYQDPIPIGMTSPQQQQSSQVVVMSPEMATAASGNKNYYYSFPEQQQAVPEQVTPDTTSTGNNKQYYYTFPEQQQQQQPSVKSPSSTTAATPNSIAVYDPITGKTQYYYSFPEQGAVTTDSTEPLEHVPKVMDVVPDIPLQQQPSVPLTMEQQQQPMSSLSLHRGQGSPTDNQHHHHFLRHDDTNSNSNNHHASGNQKKVKYYFYDPKDVTHDQHPNNGQHVHLPQYVYDSLGRLIPFKSISSTMKRAPLVTMIHPNSTVLNATVYNFTHTHPPVVDTRQKRKMSFPTKPKEYLTNWTTSAMNHYNHDHTSSTTTQQQPPMADSSIIICTVGVMALFVGALSARRMRSHQQRSILSMCIENEQLDHDAIYDTIYTTTTTTPNNAIFGSNHYNTFAQGWKGDLEKFDV